VSQAGSFWSGSWQSNIILRLSLRIRLFCIVISRRLRICECEIAVDAICVMQRLVFERPKSWQPARFLSKGFIGDKFSYLDRRQEGMWALFNKLSKKLLWDLFPSGKTNLIELTVCRQHASACHTWSRCLSGQALQLTSLPKGRLFVGGPFLLAHEGPAYSQYR